MYEKHLRASLPFLHTRICVDVNNAKCFLSKRFFFTAYYWYSYAVGHGNDRTDRTGE